MASSSLIAIRASADANSAEQKRQQERKRNILVLLNSYLVEEGYVQAAERLQAESNGVLSRFTAADNMDMNTIFTDYEAYYEMRFDKKPKFARKLDGEEGGAAKRSVSSKRPPNGTSSSSSSSAKRAEDKLPSISGSSSNTAASGNNNNNNNSNGESDLSFAVTGSSVASAQEKASKKSSANDDALKLEERLLKPPPQFGGEPELRQLANAISREIYQESPNVRFEDIVHLEEAKRLLIEAVQLPLRFPFLFTGILRPWRGILLHGPPGTGKTLLAKAVATECHTTFFNISASTLVSKWRGDSEKLVRVLFELARYHAPSTIFLDEIDSILTSRDGEGGEHEASRRMKTELLIQMDGICSAHNSKAAENQQVFVMAASNLPWDLDIALLRRLEKRVLVPLPCVEARELMVKKHLIDRSADSVDFQAVAQATEGYSGADLELLCREAAMMPVRRLIRKVEHVYSTENIPEPPQKQTSNSRRPGPPPTSVHQNNVRSSSHDMETLLKSDPVTAEDVASALQSTKPSSHSKLMGKYQEWQAEFGSV